MITPEQLAAPNTEDAHQAAVMCWAALNKPQYPALEWLYHVPNGGKRERVVASRLKAMGTKSGVPDLHLPVGIGLYRGWVCEMKVGKNTASDNQNRWLDMFKRQGWATTVQWGWQNTVADLERYLCLGLR